MIYQSRYLSISFLHRVHWLSPASLATVGAGDRMGVLTPTFWHAVWGTPNLREPPTPPALLYGHAAIHGL